VRVFLALSSLSPFGAAGAPEATAAHGTTAAAAPDVVLTREAGKNDSLLAALRAKGVNCLEMPLLETSKGPDRSVCIISGMTRPRVQCLLILAA
jgi:hypothetical protein